jgi:hypothetical protein
MFFLNFNFPATQINKNNSNFSLEIKSSDFVDVPVNQLFRYSQNYIDFKMSNRDSPGLHLEGIIEFFTPVFPANYIVNYNNFDKIRAVDPLLAAYYEYGATKFEKEINYRYSYLFQHLKGKNILSESYINFCLQLHDKVQTLGCQDNIYSDEVKIKIPYWDVPRIQQVVIENYLIPSFEEDDC